MLLIKKAEIFIKSFWLGYFLVNRAKKSGGNFRAFLESLGRKKGAREGLSEQEICRTVLGASKLFWFHRQQKCMAQSLVAYHYLLMYGYSPLFCLEINFTNQLFHNCHCWVALHDYDESGKKFDRRVIKRESQFVLLEKYDNSEEENNAEYYSDRLLQSELPILFCEENDGRRQ